jgi:uncharacterized protein YbjT (DUF2867 family)
VTTGRTAVVLGSTGLVGGALLRLLLEDPRTARVVTLGRRPPPIADERLSAHVVDLREPASYAGLVAGDVLFSALGTTRKQAGSDAARREVEHTFQHDVAAAAARAGVPTYALVSSTGASPSSRSFYLRVKGELERDVARLPFARVRILRPGFLEGERAEARRGEAAAIAIFRVAGRLPGLGALRPIPATVVARALFAAALDETPGVRVYLAPELFALGAAGDGG